MIHLQQQTRHGFMLFFTPTDCADVSTVVTRAMNNDEVGAMRITVESTLLHAMERRTIPLSIKRGDSNQLIQTPNLLTWAMDAETLEELQSRFTRAADEGDFIPAELTIVKGPQGQSLRLHATLITNP